MNSLDVINNSNNALNIQQPIEEKSQNFQDFEKMLLETFKVDEVKDLPLKKVEHAFEIFNSKEDFEFDDEDERLSNFLILTASLYSVKKNVKICFISPTWYYAMQAANMRSAYIKALGGSDEDNFSTVVPGMWGYTESVEKSDVVFMHGKDYSEYLPKGWSGRKIIQIFPNDDVPVDPHKPSCGYYYGND